MLNKLGKLLKYEFRFYFRLLPPLYLLLAILPLPAGYMLRQSGAPGVLLTVIWGVTITALAVMNFVLIIQRYKDNFLKNPGSLMFTLPVTSWALTASKAIAALSTVLMSIIIIGVSGIVYAMANVGWAAFFSENTFTFFNGHVADGIVFLLIAIIMIFQQLCLIYTAISASHILPKFRFAAGAVLYFAIMYLVEWPLFRLVVFLQKPQITHFFESSGLVKYMLPYGLAALVLAALFFWTTGFLLKHKLNLE